jgi:hypothetical protein
MRPSSAPGLCLGVLLAGAAARAVEPAAPAADAAFAEIVSTATPAGRDHSCQLMQRWVDGHLADPLAPRGLLWMAQLRRAGQEPAKARALLERIEREFPSSEWALHARQGQAELDVEEHRYGTAIERFDALAKEPSPLWRFLGQAGVKRARGERVRFSLAIAFFATAAAITAWQLRRAGGARALWPPPAELVLMMPLLLILAIAATAQEHDEARALVTVALGLSLVLWVSGACMRAKKRLVPAVLGVLQAGGMLYCAIVLNHLWGKLVDTIVMGAE